jgi:hypothetical protein
MLRDLSDDQELSNVLSSMMLGDDCGLFYCESDWELSITHLPIDNKPFHAQSNIIPHLTPRQIGVHLKCSKAKRLVIAVSVFE